MNIVKKTVKKKARGVTMKARIAALDRAALVQRLQDVGEHQKAALFHRNTSDEINRLHGALHMPGLSHAAQAAIKDRGRALLDALDQSEKAMDVRNLATAFRKGRFNYAASVAPSTRTELQS
jgi:hypothetical protein